MADKDRDSRLQSQTTRRHGRRDAGFSNLPAALFGQFPAISAGRDSCAAGASEGPPRFGPRGVRPRRAASPRRRSRAGAAAGSPRRAPAPPESRRPPASPAMPAPATNVPGPSGRRRPRTPEPNPPQLTPGTQESIPAHRRRMAPSQPRHPARRIADARQAEADRGGSKVVFERRIAGQDFASRLADHRAPPCRGPQVAHGVRFGETPARQCAEFGYATRLYTQHREMIMCAPGAVELDIRGDTLDLDCASQSFARGAARVSSPKRHQRTR